MGETESERQKWAGWKAPSTAPDTGTGEKIKTKEGQEQELFSKGWEKYYPTKEDHDSQSRSMRGPDKRRTYNRNGNVMTAVDSNGAKFVAPYTSEAEDALTGVGFSKDEGLGVPYAHEGPTHPDAKARWEALWDDTRSRRNKDQTGGV